MRCYMVEHSLRHSRHQELRSVVSVASDDDDNINVDDVVLAIAAIKKVDVSTYPA